MKNQIDQLKTQLALLDAEPSKSVTAEGKINTASAGRARKPSLELSKSFKEFRKNSVQASK